ncbi:SUPPRESSOR SRP40-LIKE PROTEIN [Salix koriyanagi]|uniref:SUPPRESSOR SRP40-LIKE PROTEIN n=1 Tax=Salix koriyanagi TaxID=2511006 RepID=A0A9Q0UZ00_9ROSI|nr:SUPPRESSOR SRP40-LIKE PROTEIN [Salix koriyanagi]
MAHENALPARKSSSSSASSESSARSSEVEKDDPANPFIEINQADVESSRGPLFPAEVSGHSLVISTQQLPLPSPQSNVTPGYDPNRLPSSIFAKPSNPAEWSVTSNESLFSIYMGNGSFSRDNAFMLYKSGEVPPKLDHETSNIASPSLIPVIEVESNDREDKNTSIETEVKGKESSDSEEMEPKSTADIDTRKEVLAATEKISRQEKMPPVEEVQVSFSSSNRSFQFPLLDAASGRTNSFHEVMGKLPSEKPSQQEPPKPAETTTPGTNPKAAGNCWFSCFSCFSFGC